MSENTETVIEKKHSQCCLEDGCFLPGTQASATNGDGPWGCFLHSGTKISRRPEITARIRENLWIVRLLERVMLSDAFEWEKVRGLAKQFCEQRHQDEVAPSDDEKRYDYERKLRNILEKRCKHQQSKETAQPKPNTDLLGSVSDYLPKAA